MRTSSILIWMVIGVAPSRSAVAADDMGCDPNGPCEDECVYFKNGVTFHNTGNGPLIRYEGRVHKLKWVSERVTKMDPVAELPGHTTETTFKGDGLKVVLKQVVIENGCYYKDENGKYAEVGTECNGINEMTLVISKKVGRSQTLKATWRVGC